MAQIQNSPDPGGMVRFVTDASYAWKTTRTDIWNFRTDTRVVVGPFLQKQH
jgi:hypothetical protein